jgi:hypothetical protein
MAQIKSGTPQPLKHITPSPYLFLGNDLVKGKPRLPVFIRCPGGESTTLLPCDGKPAASLHGGWEAGCPMRMQRPGGGCRAIPYATAIRRRCTRATATTHTRYRDQALTVPIDGGLSAASLKL